MFPLGIEPATPCFPAFPSNHSAIRTVNDMLFKLLQYFFILPYFKNSLWCARDIIETNNT